MDTTNTCYQVTGYQLVWDDGTRDSVKLQQPVVIRCIECYRQAVKLQYGCRSVNLSYIHPADTEE